MSAEALDEESDQHSSCAEERQELLGLEESRGLRLAWPRKQCYRVSAFGVLLGLLGAVLVLGQQGGASRHNNLKHSGLSAVPLLSEARPPQQRAEGKPIVEAIFSFGAPGVASPALVNLLDEAGCFQGLRSYTENDLGPITQQVDAAAISSPYSHAKMATVVLRSGSDSTFVPCPGRTDWPSDNKGTEFSEWRIHWQDDYEPRLRALTLEGRERADEEPFRSACLGVLLAFKTYDNANHTEDQVHARYPSWKLVAKETLVSGSMGLYDEDPMMLFQDNATLDCMLTIAGINYFGKEIGTALKVQLGSFCGFEGVHQGYRDQLRQLARELWPRLQSKLAVCRTVSCSGHSMGGALCELFAACANSQRTSDPDYKSLSWTPQAPAALPEIAEGGAVYLPGAERRCPRPPCPK